MDENLWNLATLCVRRDKQNVLWAIHRFSMVCRLPTTHLETPTSAKYSSLTAVLGLEAHYNNSPYSMLASYLVPDTIHCSDIVL